MQKLERLLNLIAVLLHTGRPLTASDIRERVPGYPESDVAFRRAFERDKDDLRELSVPIELIPIPGTDPPADGYRIPRDRYYLPDPGLEPDELAALQLAASAVRVDGTGPADPLWALGGVTADARSHALSAELPADPALDPLLEAISTRSEVTFRYRAEDRTVRPYRLGFQLARWYLRGHDLLRDDTRVYRLDRIEGPVAIGRARAFEIPDAERGATEIVPDRWELGTDPALVATVRIDADHAPVAAIQFDPDDVVERHDDGSIDVRISVTNRDAFRSLVLGYLDHAEVLDPPELRAELVTWLGQLVEEPS